MWKFLLKKSLNSKAGLGSESGMVILPFLLVLGIILFFILSFFGLTMTFAHVSVSQYMSYSTARRLALGNLSKAAQQTSAQSYYKKLRAQFFSPKAHRGDSGQWFLIDSELIPLDERVGYVGGFIDSHYMGGGPNDPQGMFYGAFLAFQSNIAQLQIPFLIKNESDYMYGAKIASYLGREPSQKECENFNDKRRENIQALCSSLPSGGCNGYFDMEGDNGC